MSCFKPAKQYVATITANSTPSAAVSMDTTQLPASTNKYCRQARVYAKTADVVVKFGGSTVAASNTVTSNAYADDNFVQPAGSVEVYDLRSDQTYFSGVSRDGTTAGELYVTIGNGENKTVS